MQDADRFLARHACLAAGEEIWGSAAFPVPLRLSWYCSAEEPPPGLVTSVRAIVFRGDDVLVVREPGGAPYVTPGGRCEPGERFEATLRRELLEETGWTLRATRVLGFVHLRNLGPEPPGFRYPYPDAFQIVHAAEAGDFRPDAVIEDEWVAGSAFLPLAEARALAIRPGERALLEAALARR